MKIIHFLGYSGSGKTTAATAVAREISRSRSGKIGNIKHIHDSFTFDKKGKDTERYAEAGASLVVAVSSKELHITKKNYRGREPNFGDICKIFSKEGIAYLLVEGFHSELKGKNVARIVCTRTTKDAKNFIRVYDKRILFVTGMLTSKKRFPSFVEGLPVLSFPKDSKRALNLIDKLGKK